MSEKKFTNYKSRVRQIIIVCTFGLLELCSISFACPPIAAENLILTCYGKKDGPAIPCNKVMPVGAVVYPQCEPQYVTRQRMAQYVECQSNGSWSKTVPKCTYDCGKIYGVETQPTSKGEIARAADSPWHVAVYDKMPASKPPSLICGGTIVTPRMIISAAHCFRHPGVEKIRSFAEFELAVSKVNRDYAIKDNNETKMYKIREIITHSGLVNDLKFGNDIAIVVTEEKIKLNRAVLPACIDWTSSADKPFDGMAPPGKVVGWGRDKNGNPSVVLRSTFLPFINNKKCREQVSTNFAYHVADDEFCGGNPSGNDGPQPGDSGGGFIIRSPAYPYQNILRGVVSHKDGSAESKRTSLAAFTDVLMHMEWIYDVKETLRE